MPENPTPQELWDESAQAWIASLETEVQRKVLLDPIMLSLADTAGGKQVLDVGCGEGRFCRMLQASGFSTVGIDPTAHLISEARRRDPQGQYILGGAESLPFESQTFDLVISYLTLIDILDFGAALQEMARVAKPGGLLLVANLTSMSTANPKMMWERDAQGNKLPWTIEDYAIERGVQVSWSGITIVNYHRPLSAYMQTYLELGLRLEAFHEPTPTPEQSLISSSLNEHFRMTTFNVMAWRKE
jgi:SAM-dependent methyltransferase